MDFFGDIFTFFFFAFVTKTIMTEVDKDTKPVGRPPKRDSSYVKLSNFSDGIDVNEWINMADECVSLLGFKGEEAAGFILYHIRGGGR